MKTLPVEKTKTTSCDNKVSGMSAWRGYRKVAVLVVPVLLAGVLLAVTVSPLPLSADKSPDKKINASNYKKALQGQVDTADGKPRQGRDPGRQQQTGLAQAASTPQGYGTRTAKPAAGVKGHKSQAVAHTDVYSDPSKTGVNSAGCYIDYGIPGEQCVQSGLAAGKALTCDALRSKFPGGVKVSGRDRFHLDRNHDGLACGRGE